MAKREQELNMEHEVQNEERQVEQRKARTKAQEEGRDKKGKKVEKSERELAGR